ncbi:glycosyltransferase [Paenibacillus yanchengensis]|uniref:Glycosyltransferase n=1 Tax=Paenibacillus yanchengensis TaxID=2035833 RepID=A0ABW4YGW8_9BACL
MHSLTLSLVMIVKNEEASIGRCLSSIRSYVDEIVVVDTGSEDGTIDICRSFGANVYSFPWNGSFADARNYGLEKAQGDWIFWLDADEELAPLDGQSLKELLAGRAEVILSVRLINYVGATANDNEAYLIHHPRLFRNRMGFQFIYSIHETLNVTDILPELHASAMGSIPVNIRHYGYLDAYVSSKNKFERNMTSLQKALKDDEANPWLEYHIASEYYRVQQYDKAFEYVNLSIVRFLQVRTTPPSMLYKLKYAILLATGSINGAWPGIDKAIELYPDYVDLHFFKGVFLYLKGWYSQALQTFEHCLSLGESNIQHLTVKGAGSFHPLFYMGKCHEALGDDQQAAGFYTSALRLADGTYPEALAALDNLTETDKPFEQNP